MSLHLDALLVDSADPRSLAGFWAEALDWVVVPESDDEVLVTPTADRPEGPAPTPILFVKNDDAKSGKNRLHLDLTPDDQDAEVGRLEGLGARRIDIGQGEQSWVVMADPEGNEFCVLRSLG